MIYFSRQPFADGSVDEGQFQALATFRADLKSRALIAEYNSIAEFEELFTTHLAQAVHRHFSEVAESSVDVLAIPPARTPSPEAATDLSGDASELLKEIARDSSGTMMSIHTKDGLMIQANGVVLNRRLDPRSEARRSAARDELEQAGFIKPTGYKREIFRITHAGFEASDHHKTF
ncbi:hypothetical protein JYT20_00020 [Rhodothermus sp. AH-315-K08]|nr:hypothetical protein [Rhodothermus sp. AH-315-K08]